MSNTLLPSATSIKGGPIIHATGARGGAQRVPMPVSARVPSTKREQGPLRPTNIRSPVGLPQQDVGDAPRGMIGGATRPAMANGTISTVGSRAATRPNGIGNVMRPTLGPTEKILATPIERPSQGLSSSSKVGDVGLRPSRIVPPRAKKATFTRVGTGSAIPTLSRLPAPMRVTNIKAEGN